MGGHSPIRTRTYLGLNILNIPKTWHATSPSVQMARALDHLAAQQADEDLAARRRDILDRLRHQTPAIRRSQP